MDQGARRELSYAGWTKLVPQKIDFIFRIIRFVLIDLVLVHARTACSQMDSRYAGLARFQEAAGSFATNSLK
jgi:hypothetical protein